MKFYLGMRWPWWAASVAAAGLNLFLLAAASNRSAAVVFHAVVVFAQIAAYHVRVYQSRQPLLIKPYSDDEAPRSLSYQCIKHNLFFCGAKNCIEKRYSQTSTPRISHDELWSCPTENVKFHEKAECKEPGSYAEAVRMARLNQNRQ